MYGRASTCDVKQHHDENKYVYEKRRYVLMIYVAFNAIAVHVNS